VNHRKYCIAITVQELLKRISKIFFSFIETYFNFMCTLLFHFNVVNLR